MSAQARLMRHSTSPIYALLQEEMNQQAGAAWCFIMDRQIEAPDEFASLQTHRVQLAVARRQLAFVEQLAKVGAVQEVAAEALQELVEHKLTQLEAEGPSWRQPGLTDILRRQPCLAEHGEGMLLWLRAYGELRSYSPGQCIVRRNVRHHAELQAVSCMVHPGVSLTNCCLKLMARCPCWSSGGLFRCICSACHIYALLLRLLLVLHPPTANPMRNSKEGKTSTFGENISVCAVCLLKLAV
eukprot:GHRR01033173.1.p1 GENE.GHRR01033173.1~~GHRR01033173.1.p1  ORF type:complete len:241 (+),score=39.79 GHRR01033173.1:604-1326(+)